MSICILVPPPLPCDQPSWPRDILHAGIVTSKAWPKGHTLKIHLMGGTAAVREKVEHYAREWTKYANIKMDFTADIDAAEIRVSFEKRGSWSVCGRDCFAMPARAPTMNLACCHDVVDKAPPEEYILARTIYHEFGHALGLVHEHQHPDGGIKWNTRRVYAYYWTEMGWDRRTVDRNVLQRYTKTMTQFSRFDKKSIMLYHFPKELTANGYFVDPNNVLSPMDKKFIAQMYPGDDSSSSRSSSSSNSDDATSVEKPSGQSRVSRQRANPSQPLRRSTRIAERKGVAKIPKLKESLVSEYLAPQIEKRA
ncbi:hypothetical protein GGR50DRAFT_692456 [Xylaria sp. CBS 124048]|nr:hypothetical protein GGR50DRAFT_692456 [Xylaria sp. CBS 124048]